MSRVTHSEPGLPMILHAKDILQTPAFTTYIKLSLLS